MINPKTRLKFSILGTDVDVAILWGQGPRRNHILGVTPVTPCFTQNDSGCKLQVQQIMAEMGVFASLQDPRSSAAWTSVFPFFKNSFSPSCMPDTVIISRDVTHKVMEIGSSSLP